MAILAPLAALSSGLLGLLQAGVARSIEACGESLNEMASRLGAQLDRLDFDQWGAPPVYDERKMILAIVITALVVSGIVFYVAINAWRRVQEQRLRLIESLARDGKLDARQLAEHLHPGHRRLKWLMILAWLALFAGIITLIASGFERGSSQEEMVLAGFGIIVGAIGGLAAPIMLRELHKQGVL
jgi:hypothetical protein